MDGKGKIIGTIALCTAGIALCTAGVFYTLGRATAKNEQHDERPLVHKAGNPDPNDIRDNNMVSEGSQFPVQYYNERAKAK